MSARVRAAATASMPITDAASNSLDWCMYSLRQPSISQPSPRKRLVQNRTPFSNWDTVLGPEADFGEGGRVTRAHVFQSILKVPLFFKSSIRVESMLAKLGECIATRQAAGLWSDQVDYASCGVFFQRLYLLYHVIDSCVQYFCRNSFRVELAMVIRPLKFWSPKIRHPKQPIQRPAHCFRALG